MRWLHLPVFLALLSLILAACSQNKQATPVPPPAAAPAATPPAAPASGPAAATAESRDERPVILALGDSLTAGQGVPREHSYPARLQKLLDSGGYRYRVVNAGISGDTSAGGVSRLERLLEQKPAIIILALGANDGLRGLPVAPMKANLAQIIERSQGAGARVVLAGMEIPPNYGPEYTGQFRQVFTDLAEQYGLPLIPFLLEGVGGHPELNLPDGVHPTGDGYVIVTQNVFQVLEPLLR